MRRLLPILLAIPSVSLPLAAHAQSPEAPDVLTTTATRIPTPAALIPAGATTITRATIEERGYTTLAEALVSVPGLRIVQSGGPGGNASVFIRGTNSNHVLVLRDGIRINDPSDSGNAFNFGVDTLQDIERIEIVRGPMSGVYGTGAIGGVINLISRKGTGALHGEAEIAGGPPGTLLGRGAVSGASGIWDYAANVEGRSDRGSDVTPRRERIYTGERDGFRTELGEINLGVTPTPGTRVGLLLRGRRSVFGYDNVGGFPGTDNANRTGRDNQFYGRLGVTSALLDGRWQTSLTLGRLQADRRFTVFPGLGDSGAGESKYNGARTDLQFNNTVTLPDVGPVSRAAVTFGYEHVADDARVRANSDFSGFLFSQSARASSNQDAGYAGLQGRLFERLTLTGNVRGETNTLTKDAITYRVGGAFAVPELLSTIKASYGTSFRAPSLFDRYGVDSFGYIGNPNLKPESSRGYEVGIVTDLPLFQPEQLSVAVTYFDNRITNLIQGVFAPVSTVINVARATTRGVESSLTVRPAEWIEATLTYTYTDTRDRGNGARLLRRPLNAASGVLRFKPLPGLTIAPEVVYTGEFRDFLVDDGGFGQGVGRAKSGVIGNLNVTYDVVKNITLYAYARNIGGSRFEPASGFATPGPSVLFGTKARF